MNSYYLIDYENMPKDVLKECSDLGEDDCVVLFYTKNRPAVALSEVKNLRTYEVPTGSQSADMNIDFYAGYLAGKNNGKCKIVIVSKDTGYDKVITTWREKEKLDISRSEHVKVKTESKKEKTKTIKTDTEKSKSEKAETEKSKADKAKKILFNQEVMQAISKEGYESPVPNDVAKACSKHFGSKSLLKDVKEELKSMYENFLEVYKVVEPVLSKHVEKSGKAETEKKVRTQTKKADDSKKSDSTKTKTVESKKLPEKTEINNKIQQVLSKNNLENDDIIFVTKTAVKNITKENGKQMTCNALVKKYGQERGVEIYNYIKKLI